MQILKYLLVLCMIFFIQTAQAQSVISFSGGTLENSNISLSFTAGEVITGTQSNSSINLSGGFQIGGHSLPTSVETSEDGLPSAFRLNQNYPNPFNPSTNISFELPMPANVNLEVFNSIGAKVAILANGQKPAGSYTLRFDAYGLASGMYFYRLKANGNIISTQKMLLIK